MITSWRKRRQHGAQEVSCQEQWAKRSAEQSSPRVGASKEYSLCQRQCCSCGLWFVLEIKMEVTGEEVRTLCTKDNVATIHVAGTYLICPRQSGNYFMREDFAGCHTLPHAGNRIADAPTFFFACTDSRYRVAQINYPPCEPLYGAFGWLKRWS